jgi:RimJ/RimL family protein N-acetyltransferase
MPSLVQPVRTALPYHQPEIEGDGVALRRWRPGDAAQLKAAFGDKQIRAWNLHEFVNLAEAREWMDHSTRRWRKRRGASWAVIDPRRPDLVLGQLGFRSLHLADGLAELSCWIMPRARRRHLATDSTRLLTRWAFDELDLVRLEIVHSVHNPAPHPVALGAGFQMEGVKRSLQRHSDGFHDMCLHSRIRSDDGEPIPIAHPPPAPAPVDAVGKRWLGILPPSSRSKAARGKSAELVGAAAADRR